MKADSNKKFFLLYIGGVLVTLSQLKVVPIMTDLSDYLSKPISSLSWIMSIFTISGIFLAIPGGMIISKIGSKKLIVSLMGCLFLGNILGFFTSSYFLLLITRAVEGISFSMIVMTGIVLINRWYDEDSRGVPTGLWGTFSAFGSMVAMNAFEPLVNKFGIKSPWLFLAILSLVMMLIYQFAFEDDSKFEESEPTIQKIETDVTLKEVTKNPLIWPLAIAQGCMAFVLFTLITLYPLIFKQHYHLSTGVSNFYTSLFGIFGVPFGVVAGYLIDKTKKDNLVLICSFIFMTISTIGLNFMGNNISSILQLFFMSASVMVASSSVMIIAPKIVKNSRMIGLSISFINLFYYLGVFFGTPIITKTVETFSWPMAFNFLTVVSIISIICSFIFTQKSKEGN